MTNKQEKRMKNIFQVTRINHKLETEILQYFDNYVEAYEYALKAGDQNILATIKEIKK